jgi:hypothetical protein
MCVTVAAGCTSHLTNSAISGVIAFALDKNGNCWASSETRNGEPALFYFAGCSGTGVLARGFQNTSFGGLDFDRSGNLVSINPTANGVGQTSSELRSAGNRLRSKLDEIRKGWGRAF